jgi:hypothetical protein
LSAKSRCSDIDFPVGLATSWRRRTVMKKT